MALSLTDFVLQRVSNDYWFSPQDTEWLDVCSRYLEGEPNSASVTAAAKKAVDRHGVEYHIDPFEPFIDAEIYGPNLEPLPD